MSGETPLGQMTIADVLERWPETARVFHEYKMACVGCVVAPFFTVTDAANVYNVPAEQFVADVAAAITVQPEGAETQPDHQGPVGKD